ncbi:hypothetical protein ACS0TY_010816 [Phlomoides rotata]
MTLPAHQSKLQGAFTDKHFDHNLNLLATDEDPISEEVSMLLKILYMSLKSLTSGQSTLKPRLEVLKVVDTSTRSIYLRKYIKCELLYITTDIITTY